MKTNLTRRKLLTYATCAGASAAGAAFFPRLAGAVPRDPADLKYRLELPIPPVLAPKSTSGEVDYYDIEQRVGSVQILPGVRSTVWGYNGTFPGPTIRAKRGRSVVVQHVNNLKQPTVVHLHGGHVPAESDGFPTEFILPPGTSPADFPVCSSTDKSRDGRTASLPNSRTYTYPNHQRAATLWYHDHAMELTGRNVYMGLAGFYIIEDDEEAALPLPKGAYDVPILLTVRQFNEDGSLKFDPHGHMGAAGDVMVVNGAAWPRMKVERRKYRLRFLNGSNATVFKLALGNAGHMTQIATDGGLLEHPVQVSSIPLSMAERVEVVIDFAEYAAGSSVTLRNLLGEGHLGELMRFDVQAGEVVDSSSVPDRLSVHAPLSASDATVIRTFTFGAKPEPKLELPPIYWSINGSRFDPERPVAQSTMGTTEVWKFVYEKTIFPTSYHPPHVHLTHFKILERNGKPPLAHEGGWKDTLSLTDGEEVKVLLRFDDYRGRFLLHCHNLEHEDHDMMARFDVV